MWGRRCRSGLGPVQPHGRWFGPASAASAADVAQAFATAGHDVDGVAVDTATLAIAPCRARVSRWYLSDRASASVKSVPEP
jgi:hypothetical protein